MILEVLQKKVLNLEQWTNTGQIAKLIEYGNYNIQSPQKSVKHDGVTDIQCIG